MYARKDLRSKFGILRGEFGLPKIIIVDNEYKKLSKIDKKKWKRLWKDIKYIWKDEDWKTEWRRD